MAMRSVGSWLRGGVPVRKAEDPFQDLQREMNRLFDSFARGWDLAPAWPADGGPWQPKVDLAEKEKDLVVTAELPGIEQKDIELTVGRDALTIRGERRSEKEEKGKRFYRKECAYGSFLRSIPLPAEVDRDQVEATFKNGILTVRLPKSAEARKDVKTVAVKGA